MPWSHPGSIPRLHQCMHFLPHVPLFMHNKSRPAENRAGVSSPSAGRGRERISAHTGESICNSTGTGSSMSPARAGEGSTVILQTKTRKRATCLHTEFHSLTACHRLSLVRKFKKIPQIFIIPRPL